MQTPTGTLEAGDAIDALAPEWDDLADRVGAVPFLRPGWIRAWWRAFGDGELFLATARGGGRLTGVAPLAVDRGVVRSPSNWHTPEFGFLAEDDAAAEELAVSVLSYARRRADLRFVARTDRGVAAVRSLAAARGYRLLERPIQESPFVRTEGLWDDYLAGLSGNLRSDVRRRRRRLDEQGSVAVEVADGRERLDALLGEGFEVEGSGWKVAEGTAIVSRPETVRFYNEVARWAAERGTLRLAFLRLDGRAIAFHFDLEEDGVEYHLKGGYDPEFARYSPSKVLHYGMIERAFESDVRRYEFLGADEPWKLQWAHGRHELVVLQAFARTAVGLADWAAFAWGRPLAKRALRRTRR